MWLILNKCEKYKRPRRYNPGFRKFLYLHEFLLIRISRYLISWPQSMHSAYLMRRQCLAEQINRAHLSAKHELLIQFRCSPDVTFVKGLRRNFHGSADNFSRRAGQIYYATSISDIRLGSFNCDQRPRKLIGGNKSTYVVCRNEPRHFCARSQLTVDQTFNFTLRPPIIYVHYGDHIPLWK